MMWIMRIFTQTLKLYPRLFRARFATEMEQVFLAGLVQANKQGEVLSFITHELLRFPASLVGVYVWSMRMGDGRPMAVSSMAGGGTVGMSMPGEGWGSSFMAGLPHLLFGIIIVSLEILDGIKAPNQKAIESLFGIGFALLALGMLIFNIYKGWRSWTASWIVYIYIFAITLLSIVMNEVEPPIIENHLYEIQQIVIPLLLAYLLYKITCKDRLRGLLAAIPPVTISWMFFLDSVPTLQKSLALGWIFLLAFIASVMMLRTKHFLVALGLAMAVPLLGGYPSTYLGVSGVGILPFSESGPYLQEVFRQYLPFLAMVLTIVLGPQLAVKLRMIGYKSAKAGGKIFYRLTLGGMLLGLLYTLLSWNTSLSDDFSILLTTRKVLLILAIVLFLVGFALLIRATYQNKSPSSDKGELLELAALFFPLLFLPVVILLAIPILSGNSTANWLLMLTEIGWVIAAVLVVKD